MRKLYGMRIRGYDRLSNSVNGNPRYRVHFLGSSSRTTEVDGSVGYDIPNYTHSSYENRTFTVVLDNQGHITQLVPEVEKFQKGQVVNGMTILEISEKRIFLAKWDNDGVTYYTVARMVERGISHIQNYRDGYEATAHYARLGGTFE